MTARQLTGKVAIVTGGASGIGHAIVQAFATAGARVVIADLNQTAAAAIATDIIQQTGVPILAIETDVTEEHSVEATVERTVREFGGVDILVSNAGAQWIAPIC